ncbi:MAG: nitrous oxide-stimulated promoter family protein [Proteobacteria bacterium]|nr:nitrous oxide-stimulated promoter family protein [Desulfobulbaceae bacterium]MBU4152167.1 nitrous oxide-stimulated promoter family protein [Pseudomonadota bacterium]
MIGIYCRTKHHHNKDKLCRACNELLGYAYLRLTHCPFQEEKTSCGNCPNHCYKPAMKEKIRHATQ